MDAATVFIAWATGCLIWQVAIGFRRRLVFGATWVIRVFALILGLVAVGSALVGTWVGARDVATAVFLGITVVAMAWSIVEHRAFLARNPGARHRPAGLAGAALRRAFGDAGEVDGGSQRLESADAPAPVGPEDAPTPVADRLDLVAAAVGTFALVAGALDAGGPTALALARWVIGAVALGGVTFTMVFGHRLLAKPYLGRGPIELATTAFLVTWPFEVAVMLWPTGMASVLTGSVDDGYAGILGWMWAMCAVTTGGLLVVAEIILRDRDHAKLASASGMHYLAGLTGLGAILISRAVLTP